MNIPSLTQLELHGLRVDQGVQMGAECIIWRVVSPGTIDTDTASYSNPQTVTVYEGACYFVPLVSRRDRFDVHGEQHIYQNQNRVHVPWNAFGIRIGDFCRVTLSDDEDLNLKDMTVKDVLLVSDLTLRRLTLVDIDE